MNLMIVTLLLIHFAFAAGWFIASRLKEKQRRRDWQLWQGLSGDLTHQMGTPLSALMGWIEMLPGARDPQLALSEMNVSLERLRGIAVRLAHVGAPGRFEDINLQETLEQLRSYFQKRIAQSSGIVIAVECQDQPVAHANAELLIWVLEGFVKNAIDAIEGKEGRITLRAADRDGGVVIEVEDNGRGIDPSIRGKIFDPGFSTKMGGRGMGLPLARHIIEVGHGGQLHIIRSEPGKGTLIRVALKGKSNG
jgi:signal transduction histidine kinase